MCCFVGFSCHQERDFITHSHPIFSPLAFCLDRQIGYHDIIMVGSDLMVLKVGCLQPTDAGSETLSQNLWKKNLNFEACIALFMCERSASELVGAGWPRADSKYDLLASNLGPVTCLGSWPQGAGCKYDLLVSNWSGQWLPRAG